jgi:hypothetical protein
MQNHYVNGVELSMWTCSKWSVNIYGNNKMTSMGITKWNPLVQLMYTDKEKPKNVLKILLCTHNSWLTMVQLTILQLYNDVKMIHISRNCM